MNEKLKNLNKKQFEKCLITLEMLTFETPKIYTGAWAPKRISSYKCLFAAKPFLQSLTHFSLVRTLNRYGCND